MTDTMTTTIAGSSLSASSSGGHDWWLLVVLGIGIAFVAVSVAVIKLHPVLALLIGGILVGVLAGLDPVDVVADLADGVGGTLGGTGLLIVLGAMFGAVLSESGAAFRIVDALTARVGHRGLPWVVLAASVIVGLPMFFEVGFVTLIPIVLLIAKRAGIRLSVIAFPLLAGLDAAQCLLPPHPGPVGAANALHASLGLVLGLGLLVSVPALVLTGPLLGHVMGRFVRMEPPAAITDLFTSHDAEGPRVGLGRSFTVVLLPVVLILGNAALELFAPRAAGGWVTALHLVGSPSIALLVAVLVGMLLLGTSSGRPRDVISRWTGSALAPIANITFIVGAAGGFSSLIVSSGAAHAVLSLASDAGVPVLFLTFGMAAVLVAALGSATIAGLTAASLVAPSVTSADPVHLALLALAAGAGSSFLLHVNSGGFWLSKEYFGLSVGQNLRVWTLTHTLLSLISFGGVSLLWVLV